MFEPLNTKLNLTDGQVAATVTAIFTATNNRARKTVWKFCNVGGQSETLEIKLGRNGGTQRRIKRVVLDVNEEFKLSGLALDNGDVLYAGTSNASSVDYFGSMTGMETPYTEETFDEAGRPKILPEMAVQLDAALNSPPAS